MIVPKLRRCLVCGQEKPLADFSLSNAAPDGLHTWCKKCKCAKTKEWYAAHREERKTIMHARYAQDGSAQRAQAKRWCREHPAHAYWSRRAWKLARHGITISDYEMMFQQQGGRCAICREEANPKRQHDLSVDHDHATGHVRGLLCHTCNVGLGHFKDRSDLLLAAANYLGMENEESKRSA